MVVLELALFRQRSRPPGSRAPPLARLCARTQSDNTVGKVLELWSQTAHQLKLGLKFFCSNEQIRLDQSRLNRPSQLLTTVFSFSCLETRKRLF